MVEFNNQEEVTRAVDQWSTLIRKDVVRIYPMEQKKTWEAKLVGLPPNCTAHYLSTILDQIKARFCFIPRTSRNYTRMGCAYIGFDSEASQYTLIHWVLTGAKECHFCYQIRHLVLNCPTLLKKKEGNTKKVTNNIRLAKLYVRKNIPEEPIKAFGGRSYAKMAALNSSNNRYNANPSGSQKEGSQANNKEGQQKKRTEQP
ncbi:hypothetical protein G9A89_009331 [Geosiphon pyriformis]|nr:hypothetical protein G9A89_009331 [Geosiphon pyriformis]